MTPETPVTPPTQPAAPAEAKPWWESKTLALNTIAAGLIALEAGTGLLKPLVGENAYAVLAVGLAVSNAVLRTLTSQPLAAKKADGSPDAN